MALVLINLPREDFFALHRAAEQGDQFALEAISTIFAGYTDLQCFLDDAPVENSPVKPPFYMILPELQERGTVERKLIAAPLCDACRDLPPTVRWNRCLRLLKRMWQARTGKNITFKFNERYHQPHPR